MGRGAGSAYAASSGALFLSGFHHAATLLRLGASPNAVDSEGNTAFELALQQNDPETIGLLLDHGARLDGGALIWSVAAGEPTLARVLIVHGADPRDTSTASKERRDVVNVNAMQKGWESRADQVRAVVRGALGEVPEAVTHQDFGHQSVTFDVALAGRSVIVRTNDNAGAFAATERNLTTLAGLGLPVSRVLAADSARSRIPFDWMILEKIPGRDLRDELPAMSEAQMTRLAEQIVGFQKRVMALPAGTGFGYAPLGETGPFASLWDLLHEGEAATAGVTEPRLAALVGARADYLRQTSPTCFLDDITTKNVIVQGGELQGLIDFDFVCYGDPLFWLGLTATVLASDLGPRERFYGGELRRLMALTAEQKSLVALYAAWISLGFVQKFGAGENEDWRARMAAAREGWLAEAEGAEA